jgi:2-hydroxychromene-2-carboxylate isomerase
VPEPPPRTIRPPIPVYFDFASLLSYVAHRVFGRLTDHLAEAGVGLEWRPIDVAALVSWKRGHRLDGPRRRHVLGVARALVGDVRAPIEWPDSRVAACVSLALAGTPSEATWRERIFTAVFEEGRDAGAPETIDGCLRDLGLDPALMDTPLDAVAAATEEARALGVVAVPTLMLGDWPMAGIQDDATMLAILTRFARRRET